MYYMYNLEVYYFSIQIQTDLNQYNYQGKSLVLAIYLRGGPQNEISFAESPIVGWTLRYSMHKMVSKDRLIFLAKVTKYSELHTSEIPATQQPPSTPKVDFSSL